MLEKITKKIVSFILQQKPGLKEKEDLLIYGTKIILMNIYKFPIILLVAYMLGILKYVLIVSLLFLIFRSTFSGVHANSSLGCLFSTMFFLYSSVYSGLYIQYKLYILFIFIFFIIYKYVPSSTKHKPIKNINLRKKLKFESYIIAIFVIISSLFLNNLYSNIAITTLFYVSILASPIGYKIFNEKYIYQKEDA